MGRGELGWTGLQGKYYVLVNDLFLVCVAFRFTYLFVLRDVDVIACCGRLSWHVVS